MFSVSSISNRYNKHIDWIFSNDFNHFSYYFTAIITRNKHFASMLEWSFFTSSLLMNFERVSFNHMHAKTYYPSVFYLLCIHKPKEVIPWSLIHWDSASCEAWILISYCSIVFVHSNLLMNYSDYFSLFLLFFDQDTSGISIQVFFARTN